MRAIVIAMVCIPALLISQESIFETEVGWKYESSPTFEIGKSVEIYSHPNLDSAQIDTIVWFSATDFSYDKQLYRVRQSGSILSRNEMELHATSYGSLSFLSGEIYSREAKEVVIPLEQNASLQFLHSIPMSFVLVNYQGNLLQINTIKNRGLSFEKTPIEDYWIQLWKRDVPLGWVKVEDFEYFKELNTIPRRPRDHNPGR